MWSFLGFKSWFYSWPDSCNPQTDAWVRGFHWSIYLMVLDWCSPAFLQGQNVAHIFKQLKSSYLKIGETGAQLNIPPAAISVMRKIAAWPAGEENGCSGVFGFPSLSTMSLIIKMGDLHRVKGYFTQEAHSVLVQQMFSFLQLWKSSTHRVVIKQSISPFRSDTNKSCTSKLLT